MTIGYGRNLTDVGISLAEADVLLDGDIFLALRDCEAIIGYAALDDVRQAVIANMVFNMGAQGDFLQAHVGSDPRGRL